MSSTEPSPQPAPAPAHTPGPWYYDDGRYVREQATDATIAMVCEYDRLAYPDARRDMPQDPNARLIAAAPDLLAERDRLKYINAKLSEVLAGMELQQKEDGLWLMFPGAGFNFRTLSGPITRRNLLAWFEAARAALARTGSPS